MDECLPRGSLDAAALRMLLEKERTQRAALEQEVTRLQAGLARQNAVLVELQRRDAKRERELEAMRRLQAGLTERNTLLRQQVAVLKQENARLRGKPLAAAPDPELETKPATPQRERANRWQTHAVEACPGCGTALRGGWIVRRVQVIDLPPMAPLDVTEHRIPTPTMSPLWEVGAAATGGTGSGPDWAVSVRSPADGGDRDHGHDGAIAGTHDPGAVAA